MNTIQSTQNTHYKHFLKLSKERKYRLECGSFLVFGKKLVQELSQCVSPLQVVSSTEEAGATLLFSESLIKKISGQKNPQNIFAEFPLPPKKSLGSPLLILDGVQDPGNVGTLIRSALAFDWKGIVFLPGCADPFSIKVIQSARASLYHIPFEEMTPSELEAYLQNNALPLYTADCRGTPLKEIPTNQKCALLMGSEGQGVKTHLKGTNVTIATHPQTESLNVAIAGSIIMHHLKPYE